jgi:hypothetical protein
MAKILILGGDTSTHELKLSDEGYTEETKGGKIKWKIKDDETIVKSIVSFGLKDGTKDIFKGKNGKYPEKEDDKKWKAKIAEDVSVGDICKYSIEWKDNKGISHTHDPIISIKPSTFSPLKLLVAIVSIILVFFSFKFLQKMNKN